MARIKELKLFSKEELDILLRACSDLFGKEIRLTEISVPSKIIWEIPDLGKISWSNRENLAQYLRDLTGQKNLEAAYAILYSRWEKAVAPEALAPTVPQNIKELQEAYEKEKDETRKARIKAELERFREAHRKIYLSTPPDIKAPEVNPEEEKAFNNLIETRIKPDPAGYTNNLAQEIIKQNTFPDMTPEQTEVLKANALLVSRNYVDKVLGLETKTETLKDALKIAWLQNPIHTAASLVNPKIPIIGEKTARAAQTTALTLEHDHIVTRKLLAPFVPEKILQSFYPTASEVVFFNVSDKSDEHTAISVDKESFTELGLKLEESNNQILGFAKDKAWSVLKDKSWQILDKTFGETSWYSGAKEAISKYVPDLVKPGVSVSTTAESIQRGLAVLWNKKGITVLTSATQDLASTLAIGFKKDILLSPAFNLSIWSSSISGQAFGINIGNFGVALIRGGEKGTQLLINLGAKAAPAIGGAAKAASKGLGSLVAKGAASLAAKAGLTGLSEAITSLVGGSFLPVIGHIIGLAVGWLVGKITDALSRWIQKHKEDLVIIGAVMMAGGLIFRSIPLVVFGGLTAIPGFMLARPFAGIAARAFFFGRQIGKSLAITIGTPVIVAIVVFPILVALILFIINSGAYIVPWSASSLPGLSENAYISVQKVAEPPGPFKNSDIPFSVKYTVTITAKKTTLTNIKIEYKCEVIKEGSRPPCPSITGSIPAPAADFTISPTTPHSFSYEVSYTTDTYYDSLITDTITVSAETPDGGNQTTSGSASIIIGSPPTECFSPVGDNWPANYLANLQAAIVKITTDHPVYAAKVCANGDIEIVYDPTPHTNWGFHFHLPGNDITLYSGGLGSQLNAEYILTHESAHHLSRINNALYLEYIHYPGIPEERPICSYSATSDAGEAFAEAAALYGSEKPFSCFSSGSFKGDYPIHWEFENTKVFH